MYSKLNYCFFLLFYISNILFVSISSHYTRLISESVPKKIAKVVYIKETYGVEKDVTKLYKQSYT